MLVEKSKVTEKLRNMGRDEVADQVEQRMPDPVDTDQLTPMLSQHGINPGELLGKIKGGIPGV